jgi:hypothetical protein
MDEHFGEKIWKMFLIGQNGYKWQQIKYMSMMKRSSLRL